MSTLLKKIMFKISSNFLKIAEVLYLVSARALKILSSESRAFCNLRPWSYFEQVVLKLH